MANYTKEKSYLERIADALENGGGGITPTGNIEITENGENINVAPFATATVNVSGGGGGDDMLKTTLTIINDTENDIVLSNYFPWAGFYLLKANIVDNTKPPYLLEDQNHPGDIISLIGSHTIAGGTTFTVDLYYACDISATPQFGLMASNLSNVTLVNMEYLNDPGAYSVVNINASSAITLTVTGK